MPEITNVATNTILNAKVNNVKGQILNHTNLATTASTTFNAFWNNIPNISHLVKKTVYNTKINEKEHKTTTDHHQDK